MELYIIKNADPTKDCLELCHQTLPKVIKTKTIYSTERKEEEKECYIWLLREEHPTKSTIKKN